MKVAFCLIVYRSLQQVNMIVEQLKDTGDVFIHVNKRSEELFIELHNQYKDEPSVKLVKDRVKVNWGGFSNVEALLNTFEEARNVGYDYYVHLSESDFPIKKGSALIDYLSNNRGSIFFDNLEYDSNHISEQFTKFNFFVETPLFRRYYKVRYYNDKIGRTLTKFGLKKNVPNGYTVFKSYPYYSLTDEVVEYLLNFYKTDKKLIKMFRFSMSSDEYYIPTVLRNSKYQGCVKESLHYMAFVHEHDVDKEVSLAKTLTINDFDELKGLSDKYFARKFNYDVDNEIYQKITEEILQK